MEHNNFFEQKYDNKKEILAILATFIRYWKSLKQEESLDENDTEMFLLCLQQVKMKDFLEDEEVIEKREKLKELLQEKGKLKEYVILMKEVLE